MAYCPHCGKPLSSDARFCTHCGTPIRTVKNNQPPKSEPKTDPHIDSSLALEEQPNSRSDSQSATPAKPPALIIMAVIKGLAKGLALSAAVLGPGLFLLENDQLVAGMLWLFAGSFGMMAWSYRRPWRLMWFTCFLPPLASLLCFLIQLELLFNARPPPWLLFVAACGGAVTGLVRAKTHKVYRENGAIMAQRTLFYLVVWIVAYAATQLLAWVSRDIFITAAGLVTGMFATVMLWTVSFVIFTQFRRLKKATTATANSFIMLFSLALLSSVAVSPPVLADTLPYPDQIIDALVEKSDFTFRGKPLIVGAKLRQHRDGYVKAVGFTTSQVVKEYRSQAGEESLYVAFALIRYNSSEEAKAGMAASLGNARKRHAKTTYQARHRPFNETRHLPNRAELTFQQTPYGGIGTLGTSSGRWAFSLRVQVGNSSHTLDESFLEDFLVSRAKAIISNLPTESAPPNLTGGATANQKTADSFTDSPAPTNHRDIDYLDDPPYDPPDSKVKLDSDDAKIVTITIATILIAAGIAIQIANSIAAALAQALQSGVQLTTEEINQAIAEGLEKSSTEVLETGHGPPPTPKGPTLYDKQGEPFERNQRGEYRAPDERGEWVWMDQQSARQASAALRQELAQRKTEMDRHNRETEQILAASRSAINLRNQQQQDAFQQHQQQQAQQQTLQEHTHNRVIKAMAQRAEQQGGALKEEVEQLVADNNVEGLSDLYRDQLKKQIIAGQTTAAAEERYEKALATGETIARGTVAASKAALMAVGGPAGVGATAVAVGSVSAAEEGTESLVRGDSLETFVKKTAIGFLSGAKDGAVSVYTNLPGTGKMAKLLVPAGADAAETYVRTGDARQALVSGGLTLAGDSVAGKVDGLKNVVGRELASATVTVISAEAGNYANGGKLGEAYQNALINHIGGKVGSRQVMSHTARVADPELRVRAALKEAEAAKNPIPLDRQAASVQQLEASRYREVVLDEHGQPRFDSSGEPVMTEYVNTRQALAQLQDPAASRTAKLGPEGLKNAMIATRIDKIYAPADNTTFRRMTPELLASGDLRRGDSLVMDRFSTPGKAPSLGADRDARLVIKRPTEPDLDAVTKKLVEKKALKPGDSLEIDSSRRQQAGMPPGADANDRVLIRRADGGESAELPRQHWESNDLIEVKRARWERIAQEDFYNHTTTIARSGGEDITANSHPEFFRRREELEFMRRPDQPGDIEALQQQGYSQEQIATLQRQGLTQQQIDHQAWAESHNQLFTDQHHIEASRDNADQAFRAVGRHLEPIQKSEGSVISAQSGTAQLADSEGFARMWREKSNFYAQNPPEAIAQSQKGIDIYLKIRDGYRVQNIVPPPIADTTASAMEIIARTPIGMDATPQVIARVESDLQALGYRDLNDALGKIAAQHETLKWSKVPVRDLGASDMTRIAQPKITRPWSSDEEEQQ